MIDNQNDFNVILKIDFHCILGHGGKKYQHKGNCIYNEEQC